MENMQKVVLYLRTVTKNQDVIFKVTQEMQDLIQRQASEWIIVDRVFDFGISGRDKRPGLNRLIELCEAQEIDMIVTLKVDMIYRNTIEFLKVCKMLNERNIKLYISRNGNGEEILDLKQILSSKN